MSDGYHAPEQRDELDERRARLGEEGMVRAEEQWTDLVARMRAHMEASADPAGPEVQELTNEWEELISQASHGIVDREVMEFAQRAMEARPKGV